MSNENPSHNRAQRMRQVLVAAFAPAEVQVVDDSARHAGHAGAQPGGQTHYSVLVISDVFAGLGRVERHRRVNDVLRVEFAEGLHALALTLRTHEEAGTGPKA